MKLISIITASSEKAVRRSSSRSKRWRQAVRVSVVIGEANAPASPAHAATAANGNPAFALASTPRSASGCTVPVTRSGRRGPWRSMMRPMIGATTAMATKVMPTAEPARVKLPSASRRYMSIAKPTMPTGMRVKSATTSRRMTSGWRTNSP